MNNKINKCASKFEKPRGDKQFCRTTNSWKNWKQENDPDKKIESVYKSLFLVVKLTVSLKQDFFDYYE